MKLFTRCKAVVACVLLFSCTQTIAGTFTPDEGATITSNTLSVSWSSTGIQQWVRVFDSSGTRIYDSGRLTSASGQVAIDVPSNTPTLTVSFYEKGSDGRWGVTSRTYPVSIENGSGGGSSGGSVSPEQIISALEDILCNDGEVISLTNTRRLACYPVGDSNCPIEDIEAYQGTPVADESDNCFVSSSNVDGSVDYQGFGSYEVTLFSNAGSAEQFSVNGNEAFYCAIALGCENFSFRDF